VTNTQALVLPADEDGTDDVADDEDGEEDVVQPVVVSVVEDGQEDQTGCTGDCKKGRASAADLLPGGSIRSQAVAVSQIALEDEGQVESNDGCSGHGDKQGLQIVVSNIYAGSAWHGARHFDSLPTRDVGDMLPGSHGSIPRLA